MPALAVAGFTAAILATATLAPAAAQTGSFTSADLDRVVRISEPQIAPDGRTVIALIGRVNAQRNRTDNEIDAIDVASGTRRALTFERAGLSEPRWSPSGDRIAFIANRGSGDAAKSQVYVLPMNGGDAQPVTSAPEGVEQFVWRPDGRAIAYVSVDPAAKKAGRAKFVDAYEVGNGSNLLPGAARPARAWLQPLGTGAKAFVLTPGAGSVTTGEATSTISFSADGSALAYSWAPNAILNDADRATVLAVDIATRRVRALGGHRDHEASPLFAPAGNAFAYLYSDGDNQTHPQDAYVSANDGSAGENRSQPVDQYVRDIGWQPASTNLYFTSDAQTQSAIWRAPANAVAERIELGTLCATSALDGAIATDGTLVFVASATNAPPELYVKAPSAAARKLTDYNAPIATRRLGSSERITFPTSMGVRGDGVLTRPPDFDPHRSYPLVVVIHGGPTAASTQRFDEFAQLLAARGWLVLEPNYRGSNNLGHTYLASIFNDVSAGPGRDIMAAVDAVRARGIVDPKRIAVSGWSYGGVMTTWMITHYHLWNSAVSGAAVTDWIADYAIADDLDADLYLFHGSPFLNANRASWLREESITYVHDVTTPVLLLADRGDARVANVSSYEFFHALRDLGRPVQFVVYPVDGHFPHDPARTADIYARWISYIGDHFKP